MCLSGCPSVAVPVSGVRYLSFWRLSVLSQSSDLPLREAKFCDCKMKSNRDKHWEYVLCHVDDVNVFCMSHNCYGLVSCFKYTVKKESMKEPKAYLGAEVNNWTIEGADNQAKVCWVMLSDLYVS